MTTLIPKYDQGATGATNRAINLKLAEQVSVLDFGATGNGTTDDTTAIQAAIATGKTIYFPNGNYLVSSTINLTTVGQTFRFDGTIIRAATMTAANYVFYATGIDNLSFINPKFATPATQAIIQSGGFIQLNLCNFASVLNGSFISRGVGGAPTLFSHLNTPSCNDLLISGNYFAYSYGNCCGANDGVGSGSYGKRVRIVNNIFSENVDTSVGCWTNCSDVVIANNTFYRTSNSPSYNGVMIDVAGATDVVIANNVIVGNTFGIRIVTNVVYTNKNILIANNIIKNQFVGSSDIGCGIRFTPSGSYDASIKIVDNEISVSNSTCVGIDLTIAQTGTAQIEINRNTIKGGAGYCLRTQGTGANNPIDWIAGNNALLDTLATTIHEQQTSPATVREMGAPVMVSGGQTLTAASPTTILTGYLQPGLYMIKATFGAITGSASCFYRLYAGNGTAVGTNYGAWTNANANSTPAPVVLYHVLTAGYYYVNWNISSVSGLSYQFYNAELIRVV
jgi:hypothetical protein